MTSFSTDIRSTSPWPVTRGNKVLSFITESESSSLTEIVAENCSGDGIVIDAGCFVGASTVAIARGLKKDGAIEKQGPKRIISIDRFTIQDAYLHDAFVEDGYDIRFGESFLEVFLQNVSPYLDMIEVRVGDLPRVGRTEKRIELAFIDIAKNPQLHAYTLLAWLPYMTTQSVLFHQDFHSPAYPWLPVSVAALQDYLEVVTPKIGETAVFKLRNSIPRAKLEAAVRIDPYNETGLALLDELLASFPKEACHCLELTKCMILERLGRVNEIIEILAAHRLMFAERSRDRKWLNWFSALEGSMQRRGKLF